MSGSSAKKLHQQQLITGPPRNANSVTQSAVNSAIANLVVGALLPLRIVEVPEFKELIKTLQPHRHVMCRSTLRALLVAEAATMKEKLVSLLKDQAYVATTTDCWSAYGRSYLGVTVHWIDGDTLQRKSAYLALRRLQGSHTYDVIAAALDDVHAEYSIRRKIVRTTTDNGRISLKPSLSFPTREMRRQQIVTTLAVMMRTTMMMPLTLWTST